MRERRLPRRSKGGCACATVPFAGWILPPAATGVSDLIPLRSQATAYSRQHCRQRYRTLIGHITWLCIALHHTRPAMSLNFNNLFHMTDLSLRITTTFQGSLNSPFVRVDEWKPSRVTGYLSDRDSYLLPSCLTRLLTVWYSVVGSVRHEAAACSPRPRRKNRR